MMRMRRRRTLSTTNRSLGSTSFANASPKEFGVTFAKNPTRPAAVTLRSKTFGASMASHLPLFFLLASGLHVDVRAPAEEVFFYLLKERETCAAAVLAMIITDFIVEKRLKVAEGHLASSRWHPFFCNLIDTVDPRRNSATFLNMCLRLCDAPARFLWRKDFVTFRFHVWTQYALAMVFLCL